MSTQRRRVLESDKGETTITDNGVYIEGINGKFYTTDTWVSSKIANSIVVASDSARFRMALTQPSSTMMMSSDTTDPLENYMTAISDETAAKADYDGAGNTAKILQMQPSTNYAAGYCNAFVFPDGKTKGYLPSLGQLNLAYQNKAAVDAALKACGGTAIFVRDDVYDYYWSSTFYRRVYSHEYYIFNRYCWGLCWRNGNVGDLNLAVPAYYVRPFADIP